MGSRAHMKALDLKRNRSYSSERGGREKDDWKNNALLLLIYMSSSKYPLVYFWFPFLKLSLLFQEKYKR